VTDYFALLAQPRRAWLDPDSLQEEFHRRAKSEHPDTSAAERGSSNFVELNAAYRALSNPTSRLAHILELAGTPVPTISEPPGELSDLFFETAAAMKQTHESNVAASQEQLKKLSGLRHATIDSLRDLETSNLPQIQRVQERLAYLDRWIEQIGEHLFDRAMPDTQ